MKKKKRNIKIKAVFLLCAGSLILTGCGVKEEQVPQTLEKDAAVQREDTEVQAEKMENSTLEESVSDSADVKEEAVSDEEKEQTLYEAQIRHYYGGVLSQLIAARQLPDSELDTSSLDDGFGEMRDNHFAVTDIDGDGREELIISYTNASMAGMFERIYDYDPAVGELKVELWQFPALTYYDNGIIKAEWFHNQGYGEFWPFTLYRYEAATDSYAEIGGVETWDKAIREEWIDGQPFPEELDTDGDGTLFYICKEGGGYSCEYENFKYNLADYEEWFQSLTEGAKEISVDYQPIEHEAFADFTPAYLRLKAGEANRERSDTADDLGLLILNEEHFLDAAKTLLSEKYDVVMEQPEENFEEYTAGMVDGKEVFSFTALDAGDLSYSDEKVGDVTIFGIYPGISVDGAWKKLQAYGFYASPYGEVENCLITGDGFGNISIWFSAEDNKVTQITVMPFCAFAG